MDRCMMDQITIIFFSFFEKKKLQYQFLYFHERLYNFYFLCLLSIKGQNVLYIPQILKFDKKKKVLHLTFVPTFIVCFDLTKEEIHRIFQNIQRPKPPEIWIRVSMYCCEYSTDNEKEQRWQKF